MKIVLLRTATDGYEQGIESYDMLPSSAKEELAAIKEEIVDPKNNGTIVRDWVAVTNVTGAYITSA